MDLATATKEAKKHKAPENRMQVSLSYDLKMVLPYKDGLTLLAALANAELVKHEWGKPEQLVPMSESSLNSTIVSETDYHDLVMAGILGVPAKEIKEAREKGNKADMEERRKAFRDLTQ